MKLCFCLISNVVVNKPSELLFMTGRMSLSSTLTFIIEIAPIATAETDITINVNFSDRLTFSFIYFLPSLN